MTGLMQGKRGLIMGLANDKSLAWGIAQKLHEQGADINARRGQVTPIGLAVEAGDAGLVQLLMTA